MTRQWSFGTSLQKNKRIVKLKTKRYNLNHFSMFESWAAVNVGADKHEAETEERDKQGSRTTLLHSLQVKCTTLVVGGYFQGNIETFLGNMNFGKIPLYFYHEKYESKLKRRGQ